MCLKNYHTWSYWQWLSAYFHDKDLWVGELDFVEAMIVQDARRKTDRARIVRRELTFVKQNISFAANNPSARNYPHGILDVNNLLYTRVEDFVRPYADASDDAVRDIIDLENPSPSKGADLLCSVAIGLLADIHEKGGRILQATELWRSLSDEHDAIRKSWEFRIREA